MPAIQALPAMPDMTRMIFALPRSYKERLETISLVQRRSVTFLLAVTAMEMIDALDPTNAPPVNPIVQALEDQAS